VKAVRSSVHVNCWLGNFDKASMVRRFLRREWHTALQKHDPRFVYVGDSFNDAPLFKAFGLSVGVANVAEVLGTIDHPPRFITRGREGKGFGEVADAATRGKK
jgi:hydroxymethylpyrimidine pyrophosphatase-like HAD family hydrolase